MWPISLLLIFLPKIKREVRKTFYYRSPCLHERQFMKFYCHYREVSGVSVRGIPALNEVDHKIIHTIQSQKVYKKA